jgi:FKBP-type peptidyl-prolyl cis-trans isomerase FklB
MRKSSILAAGLLTAVLVAGAGAAVAQAPAAKPPEPAKPASPPAAANPDKPASVQDRASYAIGLNLGRSFKANEVNVNLDLLVRGVKDALAGAAPLLTDEEIQASMQSLQQEVMAKQQEKNKMIGEKNKAEGDAYLAKNKARPEVKTTASGLQYEVINPGSGDNPKPTDKVTVHYKGTLIDGTVFDSSYDRKEPATFVLNQVIKGWTEGVGLMKPGAKYKFFIPSDLGYGERGAGAQIGPNSVLIFEVELLSIGEPKKDEPKKDEPKKPGGR